MPSFFDHPEAVLCSQGSAERTEVPGAVNLGDRDRLRTGGPILRTIDVEHTFHGDRLITHCSACGNHFSQSLQDLAVNLIRGAHHQIAGPLKLIYENGIVSIEGQFKVKVSPCLDPTCPGNSLKINHEIIDSSLPQRHRPPDGAGIGGDAEPHKPRQDTCRDFCKPLCICGEDSRSHCRLCGGEDPCKYPDFGDRSVID